MRKITSVFCCHKKYFVTNQLPDLYCHLPILSKSCIYSHYFFAAIKKMIVYVTVQIFEIYLYFQFNLFQFNVKLDNCIWEHVLITRENLVSQTNKPTSIILLISSVVHASMHVSHIFYCEAYLLMIV